MGGMAAGTIGSAAGAIGSAADDRVTSVAGLADWV